eukprot:CAMPEP_0172566614 /NCGR_PEP_ID=MMETSP1067-20121228/112517_1 /TAXON_ID=265564 ORGANISM="Thalassiosira punctigera, Strain Tpunct2005C2" /NCGR_SAMPLE_ID=MMETSP1067 /ASSEMBLY_ACC=CAM_ASM_000444 /LENGTH=41 /DNA_ID= /DNA_START= /DNA_END= /DNA_ORIENTATION=
MPVSFQSLFVSKRDPGKQRPAEEDEATSTPKEDSESPTTSL